MHGIQNLHGLRWIRRTEIVGALAVLYALAFNTSAIHGQDYSGQAGKVTEAVNSAAKQLAGLQGSAPSSAYQKAKAQHDKLYALKLKLDGIASDLVRKKGDIDRLKRDVEQHKMTWESLEKDNLRLQDDLKKQKADFEKSAMTLKSDFTTHKTGVDNYRVDLAKYQQTLQTYETDRLPYARLVATHNANVQQYDRDVAAYNALPQQQRAKAEFDRLNAWNGRINRRKARLDKRKAALDARLQGLNWWRTALSTRAANLDATRARLLDQSRFLAAQSKKAIDEGTQRLLDFRTKSSKQKQAWQVALLTLNNSQGEFDKESTAFNEAIKQASRTQAELAVSLKTATGNKGTTGTKVTWVTHPKLGYISFNRNVHLTPEVKKTVEDLDSYFKKAGLTVAVTSVYRSPEHQLELIKRFAIAKGLDKKYPSILKATVKDKESWRKTWDELLNVQGVIINPPVSTKSELGTRKGRLISATPHGTGKAFDLSTGNLKDLSRIEKVLKEYQKANKRIKQIKLEPKNSRGGAVHVGLE